MIALEGEPADWIVDGGRPAAWCGERGLPSYESEDGKFLVFDLLALKAGAIDEPPMMFPRRYIASCLVAPDGLVPLSLSGAHVWRPQIYRFNVFDDEWQRLSSQNELTWRQGLSEVSIGLLEAVVQRLTKDEARDHAMAASEVGQSAWDRAERLLRENLSPFQEFEYVVGHEFRVRGGSTGNLYLIRPSNGFALIDPVTCSEIASYCLHPECWLPDPDIALATKLALEDEDLEIDCLENARMGASAVGTPYRPDDFQRAAAERERELIT